MVVPATSLFHSLIWLVHRTDGSWGMTVDYCKHNQVVAPIGTAIPDVVSLLEQINIGSGPWYPGTTDQANAFFSISDNRAV